MFATCWMAEMMRVAGLRPGATQRKTEKERERGSAPTKSTWQTTSSETLLDTAKANRQPTLIGGGGPAPACGVVNTQSFSDERVSTNSGIRSLAWRRERGHSSLSSHRLLLVKGGSSGVSRSRPSTGLAHTHAPVPQSSRAGFVCVCNLSTNRNWRRVETDSAADDLSPLLFARSESVCRWSACTCDCG